MILTILTGDNISLLKSFPDNHFDSVVTDCPYGLGQEPDPNKVLKDWLNNGFHVIKGKGFMGQSWDSFVPQPLFWKEVFRVLKPGGYVLAFFGTRTYDWGTMAIRLAGFEIRDMICWHYGSGFPKSLDISKKIDKKAGAKREKIVNPLAGKQTKSVSNSLNKMNAVDFIEPEPVTDLAKQYSGFGTALKPATEPICVARKPLEGTVVENIKKYGTGGINIEGCKIDFSDNETDKRVGTNALNGRTQKDEFFNLQPNQKPLYENGRFPANVIFDPFMAGDLDAQSGFLKSGKMNQQIKGGDFKVYGHQYSRQVETIGDSGGASRFFYCAKASQSERTAGCDIENIHPTVKPIALMRYLQRLVTPPGGITIDPYSGSGTSGCSAYFEDIGEIVLMENDSKYISTIEARTKYWSVEKNRINYLEEIKTTFEKEPESQFKLW